MFDSSFGVNSHRRPTELPADSTNMSVLGSRVIEANRTINKNDIDMLTEVRDRLSFVNSVTENNRKTDSKTITIGRKRSVASVFNHQPNK